MGRKSQIDSGYYPISITDVKRFIKNCERWNYGNKDTCKYVAENVIERIRLEYPNIKINDTLYCDLISIVHEMNNGRRYSQINIKI